MRSRRDDPWTSHAAAAAVDEVAARHYRIILETLRKGPGITYRLSPSRRKCRVWARIVFTPKQGQLTLPPGPGPLPWA